MTRSLISLDVEEREWIQKKSSETGESMSQIVRIALRRLRDTEEKSFDSLLDQTSGTWTKGDGLEYQQQLRQEWS